MTLDLDKIALEVANEICDYPIAHERTRGWIEFARRLVERIQREQKAVAWYSTLSFDGKVADERVTLIEPRYPFGVAGRDYRAEGSCVDWHPCFTFPPAAPAPAGEKKEAME